MTARRFALLLMSAVGIVIAAYLTVLHYDTGVPLYCLGSQAHGLINCENVLTSPESVVLGIPVPLWGLFWFLVTGALVLMSRQSERIRSYLMAWSIAGAIVVIYLVFVEFDVLHHICIWCSTLHVLILAILGVQVYEAGVRS
jgi:uncharacterized membrane protein